MRAGVGFWHGVGEEWRNFGIGTYRATLSLSGDEVSSDVPATVTFSVWPWRLLICLVGGLFLVVLGLAWFSGFSVRRATIAPQKNK